VFRRATARAAGASAGAGAGTPPRDGGEPDRLAGRQPAARGGPFGGAHRVAGDSSVFLERYVAKEFTAGSAKQ
jgi:hypothetical protein